jgi:hypothetical protein
MKLGFPGLSVRFLRGYSVNYAGEAGYDGLGGVWRPDSISVLASLCNARLEIAWYGS